MGIHQHDLLTDIAQLVVQRGYVKALLILLSFVTVLLGGCNALSYKDPPPGSATARVRFATDDPLPAVLRVYDDSSCKTNEQEWLRISTANPARVQPKRLGMPLWNYTDASAKEVVVATDKELDGMLVGGGINGMTTNTCGVPFRLRLVTGHDYEVFFSWSPAACEVHVSEIVGGEMPRKLPLDIFSNKLNATNSDCLAAFNKPRLY